MHQAKSTLSRLARRAAAGEPIYIGAHDRAVVKLVPVNAADKPARILGILNGKLTLPDDLKNPPPDEVMRLFEGTDWDCCWNTDALLRIGTFDRRAAQLRERIAVPTNDVFVSAAPYPYGATVKLIRQILSLKFDIAQTRVPVRTRLKAIQVLESSVIAKPQQMKVLAVMLGVLSLPFAPVCAAPVLGAAQLFAALGAPSVINTGLTTLIGDLGVSPGNTISGLNSGLNSIVITGNVHQNDAAAVQAQADARNAYTFLTGLPVDFDLTGLDLGGMILGPGVYFFQAAAQLTGLLTLDAQNNPNARFVFRIGAALTTADNSAVDVLNVSSDSSVYWQVGSSATLGTATRFAGNILADQSITMNRASTITCGRALALGAALTLDTNTIAIGCPQISGGGGGSVPEPNSLWLSGLGLFALGAGQVGIALRPRVRRRLPALP